MESHHLTAIGMLARGLPAEYIAKKLDINERTLRRWKVMPEFAEELRLTVELQRFTLRVRHDQIEGKCQTLSDEGLEKIAHVMRTHPDPRICLRAANTLLSHCTRMSARSAALEKADKNGRDDRDGQLEKAPQNRTSEPESEKQFESAKPVTLAEPMSAPGHAENVGATGAPTAPILKDGSVHPCPDDHPTQKADANGHRPATPIKSNEDSNHLGTDESGIKRPDASVAPRTAPKADENGHATALQNQPPETWKELDEDPEAHLSHEEFIARLTPEDIAQLRAQIGLPNARKTLSRKPDYSQMTPEEIEADQNIFEFQSMLNKVLFPELAAEFAGALSHPPAPQPNRFFNELKVATIPS